MKVYYSGNFWGGHKFEHAGKEIPVKKEFCWGGADWHIPAVYSCSKGLVIDFCVGIPRGKVEKYLERWSIDHRISGLSEEEREQMEKENPFDIDFEVEVKIDGKELGNYRMCAVNWHPCEAEREQIEDIQEELMKNYDCDRNLGWRFVRVCLPWSTAKKPRWNTLSLALKERPVLYAGEHFVTEDPFEEQEITCIHPISKEEHRLTLYECETNTMPASSFRFKDGMQYPNNFKVLTYSISPELSPNEFGIQDCAKSDQPRSQTNDPDVVNKRSVSSIGIIGGSDGPSAIFIAGNNSKEQTKHPACSSLHFFQQSKVEWRMKFYVKETKDISLEIVV